MKKEKKITLLQLELYDEQLAVQTVEDNQDIIIDVNNLCALWDDVSVIIKNKYRTGFGEYGAEIDADKEFDLLFEIYLLYHKNINIDA